jgi:hypothetical protein
MSDSTNSQDGVNPTGDDGRGGARKPDEILAHVESPGLAPDARPVEEFNANAANEAKPAAARGTALVLASPRAKAEAPQPEPASAPADSVPLPGPRMRLRSFAAVAVIAAVVGGFAGSLTTAGVAYLMPPQDTANANYPALAQALGRVDRELTTLKTGIDGSTRTTGQQVAKIGERMDRVEKAQAEAGSKLGKATDLLDRMERRLAAAPNDTTGTTAEPRVANLAQGPAATETKHSGPAPIVDGWVLRDVYKGAAMIQGRGGIVEVIPGDSLPGLGRIEQVKRQDGRWVVVTSRGLIVQR